MYFWLLTCLSLCLKGMPETRICFDTSFPVISSSSQTTLSVSIQTVSPSMYSQPLESVKGRPLRQEFALILTNLLPSNSYSSILERETLVRKSSCLTVSVLYV